MNLFSKLKLDKCLHITSPLLKKVEDARKFFKMLDTIAPNVESLTLEDPSFDGHSLTEDLGE